jgi:Tfp pilus assembly protein PilF
MCRTAERRLLPPSSILATLTVASQLVAQMAFAAPPSAPQISQPGPAPIARQTDASKQLQLTPEDRGNMLLAERRYQAAIEAFKQAPHPSADDWNRMGIAYQQLFNNTDAMRCFQVSLKLNPRNGTVLNNIGTIYVSFKDYRSADRYYRKALKLEPQSAPILKNYGTELMLRRKYKEGGQMYAKAATIDPEIFESRSGFSVSDPTSTKDRGAMNYYMARTCARAGMTGPAIDYLRKALSEGYVDPQKIMADGEFAGLRGIPDFERLLMEQKHP